MSGIVARIWAEAERPGMGEGMLRAGRLRERAGEELDMTRVVADAVVRPADAAPRTNLSEATCLVERLGVHSFPAAASKGFTTEVTEAHGGDQDPLTTEGTEEHGGNLPELEPWEARERERQRRVYRRRTVSMLRRYLRFSIETGRLPSVLGREFFRAKVTSYRAGTFEDRVIFVHDMETCLERLDEFSRQLIARHILQEHDQEATARLLHCGVRTVRTYVPIALDMLSEILVELGLMERLEWDPKECGPKSCQGGPEGENFVSDCEESENKF